MNQTLKGFSVAVSGYGGAIERYWPGLSGLELPAAALTSKPATLQRWRKAAPEGARIVAPVAAEVVTGAPAAAEAAWKRTLAVAEAVKADMYLLHTPASFRPTDANRAAMVRAFEKLQPDRPVAWRAEGLWETAPEARDALCAAAGLVPVADPLGPDAYDPQHHADVPPGDVVYWRILGGPGLSSRVSDHDLETLLDLCEGRAGGLVVFAAPQMLRSARQFVAMLAEAGDAEREDEDDEPDDDVEDLEDDDAGDEDDDPDDDPEDDDEEEV